MMRVCTGVIAVICLLSPAASAYADSTAQSACIVDKVRQVYANGRKEIIKATYKNLDDADNLDEKVDFEEKGCISSYGLSGSFSIASIANNFLDNIKDAVCNAADNYLADQVASLSAGIDAPLGLANVGGELVRGGEGVDVSQDQNVIDFDTDKWAGDQFDRLPQVDSGYQDYEYDSGADIGDQNYLNQDRGGARR